MSEFRLFVTMDIGGTTARAAVINWPEGPWLEARFPSQNLRSITDLELGELFLKVSRLLDKPWSNGAAVWVIGAAGARPDYDEQRCRQLITEVGIKFRDVSVFTDFEAKHSAALAGQDGILSVNGTGSVVYGRCNTREERRGGWGYLLDETPSGAAFGKLVLQGALNFAEGRKECVRLGGILSVEICENAKGREGIIDKLYSARNKQKFLGSLSPFFSDAVQNGCSWSRRKLESSLVKWRDMMIGIAQTLEAEEPVPYCGMGGLWEEWPLFVEMADKLLSSCESPRFERRQPGFPLHWGPLIRYLTTHDHKPSEVALRLEKALGDPDSRSSLHD